MPLSLLKRLMGGTEARTEPEASPSTPTRERRQWPRIRLDLTVRVRFASTQAVLSSQTFDISAGGCFVKVARPRPVGTSVRLILEIAERTMTISGTVVRTVEATSGSIPGMGVQFVDVKPEDRAFLDGLVTARSNE